jgi:hypothetical protein
MPEWMRGMAAAEALGSPQRRCGTCGRPVACLTSEHRVQQVRCDWCRWLDWVEAHGGPGFREVEREGGLYVRIFVAAVACALSG